MGSGGRSVAQLRRRYDDELRGERELAGAADVRRVGPVWTGVFGRTSGFMTSTGLVGGDAPSATPDEIGHWIATAFAPLRDDPAIDEVEFKTRDHDDAPGLIEALTAMGFQPDDTETVMIGSVDAFTDVHTPAGVTVREAQDGAELRAALRVADEVFASRYAERLATEIEASQASGSGTTLWLAEVDGRIVAVGRLEPVAGTSFAGLWGGATLPSYRGRGIYRALTAARARAARELGVTLLQSDCTDSSRPILERAGFVAVAHTTPWRWVRADPLPHREGRPKSHADRGENPWLN